jgi:pyrroloquinoline-quinone synthase
VPKGKRYHIYHPFHIAMNSGKCTREQVQGWVYNRFYYQISIPIKDAAVLSNMPDREQRRKWIQRIIDHDGIEGPGGRNRSLAEARGSLRPEARRCDFAQIRSARAYAFAVDAYVNFARRAPWQEAACSSLTELFAPEIHKKRLEGWPVHYPWIDATVMPYFRKRLSEARRDVEHGLQITLDYFKTRSEQERALGILQFKLDVLWSMLDSMQINYGIGDTKHG